jgi:pimeloyl-ACP methyl ester carboxylesterase
MPRSFLAAAAAVLVVTATTGHALAEGVTREHVRGDVHHYRFSVRVGDGPNARVAIHRVVREKLPWIPRRARTAILFNHGDFATFDSNFPYLAPWLAERGVDVWGLDRRYTQAPAGDDADVSDFAEMGVVQMVHDLGAALAFARGVRLLTDASVDQMVLSGFSRGGQLAYVYAAVEGQRPPWQRHVKGLVSLDSSAKTAPEDDDIRQIFCIFAESEYDAVAAGFVDSPNGFAIDAGSLALTAPDEQTPYQLFFPGYTNQEVFLEFAGKTAQFFPAAPWYHLAAPFLDAAGVVTGLRDSDEVVIKTWFASAPYHSSMLEAADTDALICDQAPLPIDAPLSSIRVPLLAVLAAGGYGEKGLYTTTQVGSTDVTTLLVRKLAAGSEAEDYGHGDLLFARDADVRVWRPLLSWLRARE